MEAPIEETQTQEGGGLPQTGRGCSHPLSAQEAPPPQPAALPEAQEGLRMLTAGGGPRLRVRASVSATQDVQPPTLHNGAQGNAAPRTPPSTHLG